MFGEKTPFDPLKLKALDEAEMKSEKTPLFEHHPSGYNFSPQLIPEPLKHIDQQVWDKYEYQLCCYTGFDIHDFPGVCYLTPIVPMNLETNSDAISRAKLVADFAINWYNNQNETQFSVATVDQANCNLHQCYYVDPEKYIILFEPIKECCCNPTAFGGSCCCTLDDDMFYITFTAKDANTSVTEVFQAQVVSTVREPRQDVVLICRKKSSTSPESDFRLLQKMTTEQKILASKSTCLYCDENGPKLPPKSKGSTLKRKSSELTIEQKISVWESYLSAYRKSKFPPKSVGLAEGSSMEPVAEELSDILP